MPKKILVVDDEKPISDIIKFNLTKEGFDVETAYDGEEAVEKVEEYNPDLMILDLMLPKKDGLEVAREVRQTHDMPIIMVTANGGEIEKVDEWGRRRLAYPIDYKTEGYYVLTTFQGNPELPRELERNLNNDESILRFLVVRQDG